MFLLMKNIRTLKITRITDVCSSIAARLNHVDIMVKPPIVTNLKGNEKVKPSITMIIQKLCSY